MKSSDLYKLFQFFLPIVQDWEYTTQACLITYSYFLPLYLR